jgi:hypothetical protein
MTASLRITALLTLLLLLTGCQTLGERQMEIRLENTLNKYSTAIRWSYLDKAHGFLQPKLLESESLPDNWQNIRVTRYDVMQPPAMMGEGRASQVVAISFVLRDQQVEKQIMDQQLWVYDEDAGKWFRGNKPPQFQ